MPIEPSLLMGWFCQFAVGNIMVSETQNNLIHSRYHIDAAKRI